MAGVKIPDYTSLGGIPTPEAPDAVAKYNASGPGEATQQLGGEVFKAGSDLNDLYNKSMMNDNYIAFNQKVRDAGQQFYGLKGSDAVNGLANFNNQVNQFKQEGLQNISDPNVKMRMQEMMEQSSDRDLYRASMHADQQASESALQTHNAMLKNSLTTVGDSFGSQDAYNSSLADANAEIDGYGKKTGMTPDIIQADKDQFRKELETTRYTSMASQDVTNAYSTYQANKATIPGEVQTKLDAWFKPQVREAGVDNYINDLPSQVSRLAASGSGVSMNNLGNVKTASGAVNNTADFVNPSTPTDGVILAANNLRNNYQGMTLQQIGAKWTGEPDKAAAWVANASKASGISADAVPNLNDPAQLQSLLKGMNVAENSSSKAANFTDDVIAKGVQASLGGKQPDTLSPADNPMPTSAYQTQADIMAANRPALIQNAREFAQKNYPNDPTMERTLVQNVDNFISANVQSQTANYKQDNQKVMQGISGELSGGKPPNSVQELRALPGMSDTLNRVAMQDSTFYDTIPKKVGEMSSRNTTTNSPNGFETIMRSTDQQDMLDGQPNLNRIDSQDKLNSLLGRSDGNGINIKDYNDAKPLMEAEQPFKDYIHNNMNTIANANGNIDGQGQQRAMQWYQNIMQGYKTASTKPDFDVNDYIQQLKDADAPQQPEGWLAARMDQITNIAKSIWNGTSTQSQNSQPEMADVISPTGQVGRIPVANLDKALAIGYKRKQ